LPPEPEEAGVAADEQIRQDDFHGRVCDLGRDVQRVREIAKTRTNRTQMFGYCRRCFQRTSVLQNAAVVDRVWLRVGGKIIFALKS